MIELFNTVLYQPLYNLMIFFYNVIPGHDIGVAIILVTLLIKLLLLPLSSKSIKSQKALQDLQPKIDELKKKYKDDKQKMSQELMELYKKQKVNPLSSCLPLLVQFPFLIAIYRVFMNGFKPESLDLLYSFVHNPGVLEPHFLGLLDLSTPSILLAVLAGIGQYIQAKMLSIKKAAVTSKGAKDENVMASMNKSMQYFMPLITIVIGSRFPGGLALYWLTTTVLTVLQQRYFFGKKSKSENSVEVLNKEEVANKDIKKAEVKSDIKELNEGKK